MTSEARIAANRRNAAKSTGPKSTVGKAIVAQNALKHGLLARQHVVLGEDPQEFEQCRRQWIGESRPVGTGEIMLAERIAGLAWRLRRAERLGNELFDFLLTRELADSMDRFSRELSVEEEQRLRGNPRTDPGLAVGRMLRNDYAHDRALERLMMYERWIESSLYKSIKELRQVQQARQAEGAGQPRVSEPPCPQLEGEPPSTDQTPGNGTVDGADSAKQSQSPPQAAVPGPTEEPHAVPAGISGAVQDETQHTATQEESEAVACEAEASEQSQSAPDEPSCETKPLASGLPGGEPAPQPSYLHLDSDKATACEATTNQDSFAKQSQSVTMGVRVLPRPVRRVAWHYHTSRSY
jgi:hypothetical protein